MFRNTVQDYNLTTRLTFE